MVCRAAEGAVVWLEDHDEQELAVLTKSAPVRLAKFWLQLRDGVSLSFLQDAHVASAHAGREWRPPLGTAGSCYTVTTQDKNCGEDNGLH